MIFFNNLAQIEGKGYGVQIDEKVIAKIKYNLNQFLLEKQIACVINVVFKGIIIKHIDDISRNTFKNIIFKTINKKSVVKTVFYKDFIKNILHDNKIYHFTVNHFINFVNPNTKADTNNNKNVRKHFKIFLQLKNKNNLEYLQFYINEIL